MNIAVNLLPFREHLAGAGRYAQNIVLELSRLDKVNNYFLFVTPNNCKNFRVEQNNFHTVECKINSDNFFFRICWEQFIFPLRLGSHNIDILFTPSVAIPVLYKGRMFTTIHDIAFKRIKNKYPLLRRLYVAFMTEKALLYSDLVFTVSEFSKSEIIKEYPAIKKDIVVTYNGVDNKFLDKASEEEIKNFKIKYSLPDDFLLYVGAIEPGKNIDTIISAFTEYRKESLRNMFLVMTGGIGWKKEKVLAVIQESGLSDFVIILPYIEEAELPLLYKLAAIVLYISKYEGFGLPVLEGMASGVPVIASASHAVKEFAGGAAVLINPDDVSEIKKNINNLSVDDVFRAETIEKGKQLARKFTWEKSAMIVYLSFTKKQP